MKATKITIQSEFSQRLYSEFQRVGLPMHSPTQITRILNRRALSARVTTQAVRKWLYHGVFPSQDKLINLANFLGVSILWLRYGVGDRDPSTALILGESPQELYNATPHVSELLQEIVQLSEQHVHCLLHVIQKLHQGIDYISLISILENAT